VSVGGTASLKRRQKDRLFDKTVSTELSGSQFDCSGGYYYYYYYYYYVSFEVKHALHGDHFCLIACGLLSGPKILHGFARNSQNVVGQVHVSSKSGH
jgi:hypothetical protein